MATKTLRAIARQLDVVCYLDYRDFLRDLYVQAKAETVPYSYLLFAVDLGCGLTNALRLIIARKRLLSDRSAETIVKALSLTKGQRRYFIAMVKHLNARRPAPKERYLKKMLAIKQESVMYGRERERMEYLAEWYYPAVREMVRMEGFAPDPERLAGALYASVSPEKIRRALALLTSLGLIVASKETGRLSLVDGESIVMPADAAASHLAVARYHQSMIDVAKEALSKVPAEEAEFNALTLCLSHQQFLNLREQIQGFCQQALAVESEDQRRECVAQLNLQFFPLTKRWAHGV